jgi:hypothetical protein
MTGPFIFIATNRLKEGKLQAERKRVPGLSDFIEANEPRLIAFNEYVNDDGTEVGVVQVHPDTDSFEFHMGVVGSVPLGHTKTPSTQQRASRFSGHRSKPSWEMLRRAAGDGNSIHREAPSPRRIYTMRSEIS